MRRRALLASLLVGARAPEFAMAQQAGPTRRVAILSQAGPTDVRSGGRDRIWNAFFDELRGSGHEEGGNLIVEWHDTEGDAAWSAGVARRVAESRPDAVFTPDARMARILKSTPPAVPVVTITVDPVGAGLAESLARPGGSVTGFTIEAGLEVVAKRLDLIKQAVPRLTATAWLAPRRVLELTTEKVLRDTARAASIELVDAPLDAPVVEATYRRAIAAAAATGVQAMNVAATLENLAHRRLIAELALAAKLPTMFGFRENVEAGGLMSFGNEAADTFRRAAGYIARILRGASPAELPFQQPARFELVINLRTARVLDLTLPPVLLARADEVIE